jgi:hypothetical protein
MTEPYCQYEQSESPVCPAPVFVIGAPRSGTTVLAVALARHSHFWASDESFIMFELFGMGRIDRAFERWKARPFGSWLRTQEVGYDEFLRYLGLGFNALFTSRSQGKRWIDHTPHHGLMADVLAGMFPGACFLHILRDGRQVVNSMINFSRTMSGGQEEAMKAGGFLAHWAGNFREACKTWKRDSEAASDFCARHPERSLTVMHGLLEREPQETFRRILEFLGAPQEEAPAAYAGSHRINSSFRKVAGDVAASASRQNPWSQWTLEQKQVFVEEAGPALVDHGFAAAQDLSLAPVELPAPQYDRIVRQTRQLANAQLPPGAQVIVVSKGDPQLLELGNRRACHFPQDSSGEYAGGYPGDCAEAVAQLEAARERGAEFLILPQTAFWWLEHYTDFSTHLDAHYSERFRDDDSCIIYDLRSNRAPSQGPQQKAP